MSEKEMDCKEINELLTAYLDGEVTPEERAHIEVRLPKCPQCRTELEGLSVTQDNLRGMLKSMAEQVSPSPQAWGKVRAGLEKKGSWLDGLRRLPTDRTWQMATVTVVVVVIAVVAVVWQFGGVGQAPSVPPLGPPVMMEGIPGQATYQLGEEVEIGCVFTNVSSEPLVVRAFSRDGGIRVYDQAATDVRGADIESQELSHRLGHYVIVRSLDVQTYEVELKPGEKTATYRLTWDQKDDDGQQVPPGWYSVYVRYQEQKASLSGSQGRAGGWGGGWGPVADVLIAYPQGHMAKILEVNQSVTVTGLPFEWQGEVVPIDVTMTLERVELTPERAQFFLLAASPHYVLTYPSDPLLKDPMRPPWDSMICGQYRVDGVTKSMGGAFTSFLEDGIRFGWGHDMKIDPVPSDARELILTIQTWGDWEGPWEFHVPLA